MPASIISNSQPFGALTNQVVANLYEVQAGMARLNSAIAGAAAGYAGTAGTEYEGAATNFGVAAGATPGAAGSDYAFALATLSGQWATFWTAASGAIQQLDNGVILP